MANPVITLTTLTTAIKNPSTPKLAPYAKILESLCNENSINTLLRKAHFLAQITHESAGFTATIENLNYDADGLLKNFSKYFTKVSAATYARKPQAIANKVYANRMGNGGPETGEGYLYRGRGVIQLTGKDNYILYGQLLGLDLVTYPELVEAPENSIKVAIAYWNKNNINRFADKDDITGVTKAINGGSNGLKERTALKTAYYKALSV